MLRKHLAAVAKIDRNPALKYRVQRYFDLDRGHLFRALQGYSQADLVLAMMRINTPLSRSIAESLVGRPITVGPACKFTWSFNKQTPSVGRQPVVVYVCPETETTIKKRSRLAMIYHEFKPGRTKEQLLRRGVRPGDIRRAVSRGLVRIAQ